MSYAEITINDKNVIKRYLHRKRYNQALVSVSELPVNFSGSILDYGGGNGEFCKYILKAFPGSNIVLYEPTPSLRQEAQSNLSPYPDIKIISAIENVTYKKFDIIFCMEVFEHMVADQYNVLFNDFLKLMDNGSLLVISVPVEVYLPALLKGIFRMIRRYGSYDANIKNVLKCTFGRPPQNRPEETIENALPYHYDHLGFDYRAFGREVKKYFNIIRTYGGPCTILPASMNFEKYYLCKK